MLTKQFWFLEFRVSTPPYSVTRRNNWLLLVITTRFVWSNTFYQSKRLHGVSSLVQLIGCIWSSIGEQCATEISSLGNQIKILFKFHLLWVMNQVKKNIQVRGTSEVKFRTELLCETRILSEFSVFWSVQVCGKWNVLSPDPKCFFLLGLVHYQP